MTTTKRMKRVIVAGPRAWRGVERTWPAADLVRAALLKHGPCVVVHGGGAGVETVADRVARELGWPVDSKRMPSGDRHQRLVDRGASLCLAFPVLDDRRAYAIAATAERAGMRIMWCTPLPYYELRAGMEAARRELKPLKPSVAHESSDWRPIVGHEEWSVSANGDVRGPRGRLLIPAPKRGHLYFRMNGTSVPVASSVLEAFAGPPPDRRVVVFRDGDPTNVRLTNLEWWTPPSPAHAEAPGVETWRPVVGWEQTHEVSTGGRVCSRGKMLTVCANGQVRLCRPSMSRSVASLVLEAFVGPKPGADWIAQRIDPAQGFWPENLEWRPYAERTAYGGAVVLRSWNKGERR